MVEQAVAFVRRHTSRPLSVKGLKCQQTLAYPPEALREVIVNALAHRDYADPAQR
jgi:ATP-dependent DNA helicase RecG